MDILIMQAFAEEMPQTIIQVNNSLDVFLSWVNSIAGIASLSLVGTLMIEFLCRLIKTEKPKSIFLLLKVIFNGLGSIFAKLAKISIAISELLDRIIPQRLENQEDKK